MPHTYTLLQRDYSNTSARLLLRLFVHGRILFLSFGAQKCHARFSTSIPTLMEYGLKSNSIENLIPEYKDSQSRLYVRAYGMPPVSPVNTEAMRPSTQHHHLNQEKLKPRLFLLLGLALLLQDLLDDLLLLDEERPDDAVPDAVTAPRAAVRALDSLLGLGDLGILAGAKSGNLLSGTASAICSFCIAVPRISRRHAHSHTRESQTRRIGRRKQPSRSRAQSGPEDAAETPSTSSSNIPQVDIGRFVALGCHRGSEHPNQAPCNISRSQTTYPRELDTAVATLGRSTALLDVEKPEFAAGGLDGPRQV